LQASENIPLLQYQHLSTQDGEEPITIATALSGFCSTSTLTQDLYLRLAIRIT